MEFRRIRTGKEQFFFLLQLAYILLALPLLLVFGTLMVLSMPPAEYRQDDGALEGTIIIWLCVIVPVGIFFFRVVKKSRFLKRMVNSLRSPEYFSPESTHEMYHEGDCKYLGIDIKNGTILYIHRVRKGQMDVIGMNLGDWTQRELEGNILRLYTKFPELPRIEFSTPWAQRWYDTLGAMEYKRYEHSQRFSDYVNSRVEQLERDTKVQISKLA
ncbi:plasmid IncI1-type surface exclusion protein ExcA [Pseudomonas syringae]|nr:plasmid IncI1-type surface exclusion protein ExcA [Pseudomonas syringae]MBD8803237.1 plasmid IncI1-type surface exclusion protein ExcA [Pseudomonas syringae]MBD8814057.1 plasmid IncI1-type surface exclusion protein ExcA [Pseudomonas syringae]